MVKTGSTSAVGGSGVFDKVGVLGGSGAGWELLRAFSTRVGVPVAGGIGAVRLLVLAGADCRLSFRALGFFSTGGGRYRQKKELYQAPRVTATAYYTRSGHATSCPRFQLVCGRAD